MKRNCENCTHRNKIETANGEVFFTCQIGDCYENDLFQPKTKETRKNKQKHIFNLAWNIARSYAVELQISVREAFSAALSLAWKLNKN